MTEVTLMPHQVKAIKSLPCNIGKSLSDIIGTDISFTPDGLATFNSVTLPSVNTLDVECDVEKLLSHIYDKSDRRRGIVIDTLPKSEYVNVGTIGHVGHGKSMLGISGGGIGKGMRNMLRAATLGGMAHVGADEVLYDIDKMRRTLNDSLRRPDDINLMYPNICEPLPMSRWANDVTNDDLPRPLFGADYDGNTHTSYGYQNDKEVPVKQKKAKRKAKKAAKRKQRGKK